MGASNKPQHSHLTGKTLTCLVAGAILLGAGCNFVGMVGGVTGDAPAITGEVDDGPTVQPYSAASCNSCSPNNNDPYSNDPYSQPQPPPPPPPPPPLNNDPNIALEGEGCWKRQCYQGLACVAVFKGKRIIAKHCMERCGYLGKDPNCDGGEVCAMSKQDGRVCFNPNNPKGGYTSNGPGSNGTRPPNGGTNPMPNPGPGGQGACGNALESQVFMMLNQERANNGRGPVQCDMAASQVARNHSQDMCNRNYFSHNGPDGSSPWSRLQQGGVPFASAGENIAMGYRSPQAVHQGWMTSPGHRKNMLGSSWTRVGIGQIDCHGTPYWTEVFMR
jgi:uncharacterized protein YkwD